MQSPAEYLDLETVAACDLCGGAEFRTIEARAAVVECRACGFRFVTPRPTQAAISHAYSSGSSYAAWTADLAGRQALWERRWRRVKRYRTAPGRLLDVGAGLGTFLALAARDGWSAEGSEVSVSAVAHARQQHGIELRRGQLEQIELAPGYDLITLWHVIEHVPSPMATLARIRGLIAGDGLLVLALPNDGRAARALSLPTIALRALVRRRSARYEPLRPGGESHLSHFSPRTIRRALAASGFSVVYEGVDDAQPRRSRRGRLSFAVRRALTTLTPWNFGREMLMAAAPADPAKA